MKECQIVSNLSQNQILLRVQIVSSNSHIFEGKFIDIWQVECTQSNHESTKTRVQPKNNLVIRNSLYKCVLYS